MAPLQELLFLRSIVYTKSNRIKLTKPECYLLSEGELNLSDFKTRYLTSNSKRFLKDNSHNNESEVEENIISINTSAVKTYSSLLR